MALHGTAFLFNGLSFTAKEFKLPPPGSFNNGFRKFRYVSLSPLTQDKAVLCNGFGRGDQLYLLPRQCLNLQMGRSGRPQRVKSEDSEGILGNESIGLDEQTLKEELQNAVAEENYAKAAKIRDTLNMLQKDNKTTLLGANSRFYESFKTGDLAAMQALWVKKDEVCCVHPGAKGISGYDYVIESWNFVWANYEFPLEIKLEEIKVHTRGDMGYVTCMEFVKTRGGRWGGQFVTNVFEKIDGQWFICTHHASPIDM